jgi:hypothetical protein
MQQGFGKNDCTALEIKLVERMNDITVALTRELADRKDTKKNFRLVERQLRNIFTIALANAKKTGIVSQSLANDAA